MCVYVCGGFAGLGVGMGTALELSLGLELLFPKALDVRPGVQEWMEKPS